MKRYFCAMKSLCTCFFLSISVLLAAQFSDETKSVDIKYVKTGPTVDGVLDDDLWSSVVPATDFWQYFPTDSLLANGQSEVYLVADDNNLYVGIKCFGAGNDWIVNSLKRDYRAGGSDNITLVFDTFDDNTNGIFFGINPEGVIREGVVTNGGNGFRDFSESWDNKWKGEAKKFDGYYTAELEIPFSTLRFDPANKKWGMVVYRFDTQDNEMSVWKRTPRNQTLFSLAYTGELNWEQLPGSGSSKVSVIPFVTAGGSKDFEANTPVDRFADIGGDVKVAVTPGLNLDLTVNPDFSQVEVDRQVTNLSRFELFFPERRQFFVENADLFGDFGFSGVNPFFSRRIGVGTDVNTGSTVQNRILGGLRLSGKLNKNTRVGLLNMQTAENVEQGLPSINYSVAVLQKKIWDRSNIGFIFVNKQSFADNVEALDIKPFNRIAGLDFNYASTDNTWSGKTFLHTAITPDTEAKLAHGAELNYNKRDIGISWSHTYVQDDYNAEVGFIRRTNFIQVEPELNLRFYPTQGPFNRLEIRSQADVIWRPGFGKTDHEISIGTNGQFNNSARFFMDVSHNYVYLFGDFDPTGTSSAPLPGGTEYNYVSFQANISTDSRKNLSANFGPVAGGYFNGSRVGMRGSVRYRYQPKGMIELNYSWNHFNLPHLDETKQTLLIGPRVDYTFSKALFATAFVQYNTQAKNTNINARLQWRFAPVSDFFIVFTDNYFTGNLEEPSDRFAFNIKNRAIVAKMTYWINV